MSTIRKMCNVDVSWQLINLTLVILPLDKYQSVLHAEISNKRNDKLIAKSNLEINERLGVDSYSFTKCTNYMDVQGISKKATTFNIHEYSLL